MKLYFGNGVTTATTILLFVLLGFLWDSIWHRENIVYWPGLFPLVSVPTLIGCVGAALILIAAIATPIAKSQGLREVWFYLASAGVMLKILTVEISRLLIH